MSNFDTHREIGPLPDFAVAPPRHQPLPAQEVVAAAAPAHNPHDLLNHWYFDPVQFAWDCFEMRLWKAQRDICAGFVRQAKKLDLTNESGYVAVKSGQKVGKALALETPIPTPSGWATMGALRVGDEVFDERGKACRIVAATEVMLGRPCSDVEFDDGTIVTADEQHQWRVTINGSAFKVITTGAVRAALAIGARGARVQVDHRDIVGVRPRESVPVRCIQVDSTSSLFLCSRSFIPTHNSRLVALIALWWAVTRDNGRVVLIAPTGNQIRTVLWAEITTLYSIAAGRLKELGGLGGQLNVVPDLGLQFSSTNWIVGRATNKPERMQGTSGRNVMYLADEASGIEKNILEVARGNIQGGGILGMFGNPNQTTGAFYDAFNSEKALFDRFSISSEDTPNFKTGKMVIEGLALRQTILQNRIAWGGEGGYHEDPRYQVRVFGDFPTHASNAVISLAMIKRAHSVWFTFAADVLKCPELARSPATWDQIFAGPDGPAKLKLVRAAWETCDVADPESKGDPLILGVDPARMGDDSTSIRPRRGYRAFRRESIQKHDTTEVVDRVMHTVRRLRRPNEIVEVRVDAIGLGVGVFDQLRRTHGTEVRAVAVVSSETANNDDEYSNLRSELHFGAAAWLRGEDIAQPGKVISGGGGFEPYQPFEDELVAAQYGFDGTGRLQVEKKVQIKKRLGRSPDDADAFHLAVFDGYRPGRIIAPDQIRSGLRTTPRTARTRGPR